LQERGNGEPAPGEYCRSVKNGALRLEELGAKRLLVIPADVPLIDASEISEIVLASDKSRSVALVPAAADAGTNAICSFPPNVVEFRFGDKSFEAHCSAAREVNIVPRILDLPGVSLDIDRPADLHELADAIKTSRGGKFAKAVVAAAEWGGAVTLQEGR
jgi:2-phospho-L-lactate guanylyltransferase (CobY/MobA/RfbA family)